MTTYKTAAEFSLVEVIQIHHSIVTARHHPGIIAFGEVQIIHREKVIFKRRHLTSLKLRRCLPLFLHLLFFFNLHSLAVHLHYLDLAV